MNIIISYDTCVCIYAYCDYSDGYNRKNVIEWKLCNITIVTQVDEYLSTTLLI